MDMGEPDSDREPESSDQSFVSKMSKSDLEIMRMFFDQKEEIMNFIK